MKKQTRTEELEKQLRACRMKIRELEAEHQRLEDENRGLSRRVKRPQKDRDRFMAAAEVSDPFFKQILEALPDPVIVINLDYTVVFMNRAARTVYGDRWDSSGLTCHEISHQSNCPCSQLDFDCPLEAVIENKQMERVEHTHFGPDGTPIHMEITATPLFDASGELVQIVETSRDISSQRAAECQLTESEDRYQCILETIPIPIFFKDAQGVFMGCNTAFEEVIGLKKEQVIGKTVYEIAPKYLADIYTEADRELFRNHRVQIYESRVKYGDGSIRHVVFHKAVFPLNGSPAGGLVGVLFDLSKLKKAEKELRESKALFDLFMDHLPALAFMKDEEGCYLYTNKATQDMYNERPGIRIGKTDWELWPEETARELIRHDREVVRSGKIFHGVETVLVNGNKQFHQVTKFPIFRQGEGRILAGFAFDVTETILAQEDRDRLEAQLKIDQKMKALGTLAGGIAHDFNNILSGIVGYTEIALMSMQDRQKSLDCLKNVLKTTERAKDLIRQILAFTRHKKIERKPVKVSGVVKDALKLLRATLPAYIEIEHEIESAAMISGDATQLHQIIMNLCANAAHAMQKEGGKLSLKLAESAQKSTGVNVEAESLICLTISDTGGGIPDDILDQVFDPFFTTKEKGEGTGLGLAVVHGIVQSWKGGITVESELGKGTTFNICFPVVKAEDPVALEEAGERLTGDETILFVDDEILLTETSKELLEFFGYKVLALNDSQEAFELFQKEADRFDLVISDMSMPRMPGDVLGKKLMEVRPDIPIIICSGYSDRISEETALKMGFKGFMMKPVTIKNLAKMIRDILNRRK